MVRVRVRGSLFVGKETASPCPLHDWIGMLGVDSLNLI